MIRIHAQTELLIQISLFSLLLFRSNRHMYILGH